MLLFLMTLWAAVAAPRVIAIGDIHADPEAARATLKMAKLIDDTGRWTGGDAVLIQTGDVTDKGPSSRQVITLLTRLRAEAREVGGDVIAVLGNHEVMNLVGDWRGVRPTDLGEYDAPAKIRSTYTAASAQRWHRWDVHTSQVSKRNTSASAP